MWTIKRDKSNYEDHLIFLDGDRVVMELHNVDYYPWVEMPSNEDAQAICDAMNKQKESQT